MKPAMIFTDHMVLQREKKIPVWGTGEPGEAIRITLGDHSAETRADAQGNWRAFLPEMSAARGLTLTISGVESAAAFSDVCVGEVWLAGGQSNMEYLLGFEKHFEEVVSGEMNPDIRFFDYPEVCYEGQLEDFPYVNQGFWRRCTPEDLGWFSAVGYYFAQNLQKALDIPVGIVGCNWGGTPACAWMDPEYLKGTEGEVWVTEFEESVKGLDMAAFLKDFRKNPMNDRTDELHSEFSLKGVKNSLTREEQAGLVAEMEAMMAAQDSAYPANYERRPGGLYETMLKKIVPYGIRGVIWYQGETDGDFHPDLYTTVFSRMIENWRSLWGEELPFIFAQLAPFERWMLCFGRNYGKVRSCQDEVSKKVPGTWMVTTGDVGMQWDIHPKNKKPVGERMALAARGHVYGERILCDPPEMTDIRREDGMLRIRFANAEGLHLQGDTLQGMQAILCYGVVINLTQGSVEGNELVIPDPGRVAELCYGQGGYYEMNLYNEAGIPPRPFRAEILLETDAPIWKTIHKENAEFGTEVDLMDPCHFWSNTDRTLQRQCVDAIRYKYENRKGEIIFYGPSNLQMWYSLEDDMLPYVAQNHGMGGCVDQEMIDYAKEMLYDFEPSVVFFQTGSNDIANGLSLEEIKENKRKMYSLFLEKMPETRLVVMSGLPLPNRQQYWEDTVKVNSLLKEMCDSTERMYFMDATDVMMSDTGTEDMKAFDGRYFRRDYFRMDGIHLNKKGHDIWTAEMKKILKRIPG